MATTTKKQKTPLTEEEKKTARKTVVAAAVITVIIAAIAVVFFTFNASPDLKLSAKQKEEIKKIKWQNTIPESKWKIDETNIPEEVLPNMFKGDAYIIFDSVMTEDAITLSVVNGNKTYEGELKFVSSDSGVLSIMDKDYEAKFSSLDKQNFDANTAIMRLSYQNWGSIDFFWN